MRKFLLIIFKIITIIITRVNDVFMKGGGFYEFFNNKHW